jgi:ATP/maltotriose-dependent transcriptional regulator MalT
MMAQRFAGQGNYDGAMRAYSDARELAEAQGDLRLAAGMVMQIGYIDLARGGLADARKVIESALKPEISPEVRANLLIILASTLYSGGDSEGARSRLAQAEALVKNGASKTAVILMRSQLAYEDGDYKTAEKLAREGLGAEKALAPLANLDLAAALVGQKRWAEALAVLPEIETSPLVEGPVMKLMVSSIEASARAPSDLTAARKQLADGIQAAGTMGLVAIALELRLRLGEVEVHHGDAAKGRALLADVAAEAKQTGLTSIEHRALRDE